MEHMPFTPKKMDELAVLISGGTSGVGLAAAICFAEQGAPNIAIMGRNAERGQEALAKVKAVGSTSRIEFLQADANDPAQCESVVEKAHKLFGSLDVMVNSTHSTLPPRLAHQLSVAELAPRMLGTAQAPMQMSRAVLPIMMEQKGGVIINVASDAAKTPTPGGTTGGAAMAAIVMFSRVLAMEAKRYGIRVNALTPALISDTPMFDLALEDEFGARVFAEAKRKSALGFSTPRDLGALIAFLSGPDAGRLTGQAISVNGGMSAQ